MRPPGAASSPTDGHIDAIVFDLDGTLVDTMPLHYEAYRRVFADVGLTLSRTDFFGNIGGSAQETIPKFLRGRPTELTIDELHGRKKALIQDLFKTEPINVLPSAQLLDAFAGRCPMALASSGARVGIEVLLGRLGWDRYFQAVLAGEDTKRGKPAPDIFLLAASRLKVEPSRCLVFEDTNDGVAAAIAAGMRHFDVRNAAAPTSLEPTRDHASR